MRIPLWLLRLLPMWDYLCPKCRREVSKNSHKCLYCGEVYGQPLRVPPRVLKDKKALEDYVHKYVFPRVSAEQREYLARYFTVIFSDGFESGDFSAWDGTATSGSGSSITVTDEDAHHGSYCMKCYVPAGSGNRAYAYKTFSGSVVVHARAYIKFVDNLPDGPDDHWYLLRLRNNNGSSSLIDAKITHSLYDGGDGELRWGIRYLSGSSDVEDRSYDVSAPEIGVWYCVELKGVVGNGNGEARMYVDGVEIYTKTNLDNDANDTDIDGIWAGDGYNWGDVTHTFYVDCVVVADTYIGPEGGLSQTVNEAFTVADSFRKKFTKSLSDGFTVGEASPKNFTKFTIDSLTVSDSLVKRFLKKISDNITATDVLSKKFTKSLTDLLSIGDSTKHKFTKNMFETLTVLDSFTKQFTKKFSDIITITDSQSKRFAKKMVETLTFVTSEIGSILGGVVSKTVTETLTIADNLTKNFAKKVSDSVTVADSQIKTFTKSLTDFFSIDDEKRHKLTKKLSETINVTTTKTKQFLKRLSENITLSDAAKKTFSKQLSDAIAVADSQIKNFNKKVSEAITVATTETFRDLFNGIVMSLRFRKRKTTFTFLKREMNIQIQKRKMVFTVLKRKMEFTFKKIKNKLKFVKT